MNDKHGRPTIARNINADWVNQHSGSLGAVRAASHAARLFKDYRDHFGYSEATGSNALLAIVTLGAGVGLIHIGYWTRRVDALWRRYDCSQCDTITRMWSREQSGRDDSGELTHLAHRHLTKYLQLTHLYYIAILADDRLLRGFLVNKKYAIWEKLVHLQTAPLDECANVLYVRILSALTGGVRRDRCRGEGFVRFAHATVAMMVDLLQSASPKDREVALMGVLTYLRWVKNDWSANDPTAVLRDTPRLLLEAVVSEPEDRIRKQMLLALKLMSSITELHTTFDRRGILRTVYGMLGDSGSRDGQICAARILRQLARSTELHTWLGVDGGIEKLHAACQNSLLAAECSATLALLMASPAACLSPVAQRDGFLSLIQLMQAKDKDARKDAKKGLDNIIADPTIQQPVEIGLRIPDLVKKLTHTLPRVRFGAAKKLMSMASSDATLREWIGALDAIPPLVKSLSSKNKLVRRHAADALNSISFENAANAALIVESGGVKPLLDLLSHKNQITVGNAVGVLWSISKNGDHHESIMSAGAIDILILLLSGIELAGWQKQAQEMLNHFTPAAVIKSSIGFLSHKDGAVRGQAAHQLSNLLDTQANRQLIARDEVVERIIALLTGRNTNAKKSALIVLHKLASDHRTCDSIAATGGVETLLTLLADLDEGPCLVEAEAVVNAMPAISIIRSSIELLSHKGVKVRAKAAEMLSRLSEVRSNLGKMRGMNLAKPLMSLLCSDDLMARPHAVQALCNLSVYRVHLDCIAEIGIEPLIFLLADNNATHCHKNAEDILSKVPPRALISSLVVFLTHQNDKVCLVALEMLCRQAKIEANLEVMLELRVVKPLVFLLRTTADAVVKEHVVKALWHLSMNADHQACIAGIGIELLILLLVGDNAEPYHKDVEKILSRMPPEAVIASANALLSHQRPAVRKMAVQILGRTQYKASRDSEGSAVAVKTLVALLSDKAHETRKHAAESLTNLIDDEMNQELIVKAAGIPPLVALLSDGNVNIRVNATYILSYLAENTANKKLIAEAGGIPCLIKMLSEDNIEILRCVVNALLHLAANTANKALIARAGGIAPLVNLLANYDDVVKRDAVGALWYLTENEANQVLIAQAGAIPTLVAMNIDEDEDLKLYVVGALNDLAENEDNQALISRAGGIPRLVALLKDKAVEVRKRAAAAVYSLAENENNKELIAEADGIPRLVAMLADEDEELKGCAVGALCSLAENEVNQVLIAQAGGIPHLVAMMADEDEDLKSYAVGALFSLAENEANQVLIAQAGGIPALVNLISQQTEYVMVSSLADENEQLERHASGALYSLAENAANKELIAQAGGIPALVALFRHKDEAVKGNAVGAVWRLSLNAMNQGLIADAGGISGLVGLLSNEDDTIRQSAVGTLWALANNPVNKRRIAEAGGVPLLVGLLSNKDKLLRNTAVATLMVFAVDASSLKHITNSRALKPLAKLLSDTDISIRSLASATLWLLTLHSKSKKKVRAVVSKKRLKLLAELDLSGLALDPEQKNHLFEFIANATALSYLDLTDIDFGRVEGNLLMDAVASNKSLTTLNVCGTGLEPRIIKALERLLRRNAGGESFDLKASEDAAFTVSPKYSIDAAVKLSSGVANKSDKESIDEEAEMLQIYLCAKGGKIMLDPVVAADGETYEREVIEAWLVKHKNSPKSGVKLPSNTLFPNNGLRRQIKIFLTRCPELWDTKEIYVSKRLARKLVKAVREKDAGTLRHIVQADRRLLIRKLVGEKHLLELALQTSPDLVAVVIDELAGKIWVLPEMERDEGITFFRLAAHHLGSEGAKIIKKTLGWTEKKIQGEFNEAMLQGDLTLTRVCLELGANIELTDKAGSRPLHRAVAKKNTELTRLLASGGASKSALDAKGRTALHGAVIINSSAILSTLLARQSSDRSDFIEVLGSTDGLSALHLAIKLGYTKLVSVLLRNGANIEAAVPSTQDTAILHAVREGRLQIVTDLLEHSSKPSLSAKDSAGNTPLHLAFLLRRFDLLPALICAGANLEAKDKSGNTALLSAAAANQLNLIKMMLHRERKPAKINACNTKKANALHIAAQLGDTEKEKSLVGYLLEQGINALARDVNGKKPEDLAFDAGNSMLADFIPTTVVNLRVKATAPAAMVALPVVTAQVVDQYANSNSSTSRIIKFDETEFTDTKLHRLGGSSFCSGVFKRRSDGQLYVGKSNNIVTEDASEMAACAELIGLGLYKHFGVSVSETAIARLPIIFPQGIKSAADMRGMDPKRTHAVFLMSKMVAGLQPLTSVPKFRGGDCFYIDLPGKGKFEVINFGKMLAVSKIINDPDVLGASATNFVCQLVGNKIHCIKIDANAAFNANPVLEASPREIRFAMQSDYHTIRFDDLPRSVKKEFLDTILMFIQSGIRELTKFFVRPGAENLLAFDSERNFRSMPQILLKRQATFREAFAADLSAAQHFVSAPPLPRAKGFSATRPPPPPLPHNAFQHKQAVQADIDTMVMQKQKTLRETAERTSTKPKEPLVQFTINYKDLRYSPKDAIGTGAFSTVYKGSWSGIEVAIKKFALPLQGISTEIGVALRKEAAVMRKLNHPNVMSLYGFCVDPGHYSLVLRYVAYGALFDLINDRCIDLPWKDRLSIATGIAQGVKYLHDKKIVHRDLKSANILVDEGRVPVITDFGLSRFEAKTKKTLPKTKESGFMGTVSWMAPELFKRHAQYSRGSDVFAFAVILWELAARTVPWSGDATANDATIMSWTKDGERNDMPQGTPMSFVKLIEQCWAQKKAERPAAKIICTRLASMQGKLFSEGEVEAPVEALAEAASQSDDSMSMFDF